MSDSAIESPSVYWLVPFLLLTLRERDSYGQELAFRVADFGVWTTHPGAIYETLWQMEKEGMVVSEGDGLSRQRYSIARPGEVYLEAWAQSLARHREEINLFFEVYADGAARGVAGKRQVEPDSSRNTTHNLRYTMTSERGRFPDYTAGERLREVVRGFARGRATVE